MLVDIKMRLKGNQMDMAMDPSQVDIPKGFVDSRVIGAAAYLSDR
jgi:hypothetical protein